MCSGGLEISCNHLALASAMLSMLNIGFSMTNDCARSNIRVVSLSRPGGDCGDALGVEKPEIGSEDADSNGFTLANVCNIRRLNEGRAKETRKTQT